MKKTIEKLFSCFMAFIVIFGSVGAEFAKLDIDGFSVSAYAAEDEEEWLGEDYSDLTPNQYMSKILLNSNYIGAANGCDITSEPIAPANLKFYLDFNKASTARCMVNTIHGNESFMTSVAAWETLTFNPANITEDVMDEEGYYTAILFSILDTQMNDNDFLDALNCSTNKTIISLSKSVSKLVSTQLNQNNVNLKNIELSALSDTQKHEIFNEMRQNYISESFYTKLSEYTGYIDLIVNSANTVYDLVNTVSKYSELSYMDESIKAVIYQIYMNTPDSNVALKSAAYKVYSICSDAINSKIFSLIESGKQIFNITFKTLVGETWTACLSAVSGNLAGGVLIGQAIGKTISNFCFSTDATIEKYYALNALVEFEEVIASAVNSLGSNFKNNESIENANIFMKSVEILFSTYILGYEYTYAFADVVLNKGLANNIINLFGENETLQDYKNSTEYLKKMTNLAKNSLVNLESYSCYYEFDAPAAYKAYFNTQDETPAYSDSEPTYINYTNSSDNGSAVYYYTVNSDGDVVLNGCLPSSYGCFVIPDDITVIGNFAFSGCKYITSVIIPSSVKSIGECAFYSCENLAAVELNEGLLSIGSSAFGKTKITDIRIPKTVTSMNSRYPSVESAFYGIESLKTVTFEYGMLNVPEYALYECSSVTEINLPSGLTSIGKDAFCKCSSLTSIAIPDSVTSIGGGAFRYCNSLTSVTIPDNVTSIENRTFEYCTSLTSVTIPNNVKSIGEYAFSNCDLSLTIYGYTDSIAESFAVQNSINFVSIGCAHKTTITINEKTATCTEDGLKYKECSACKDILETEIIEKTGHKYGDWVINKEATCDSAGRRVKMCAYCGDMIYDVIPALGHKYGDSVITKEPTCVNDGSQRKTCSTCGDVVTISIPAVGHNYSTEWTIDKAANCTEYGSKSHHCLNCDDKIDITVIAPTGHKSSDWIIDKEASCTENGLKHKECTVCGEVIETVAIAKTAHKSSDWITDKNATASAAGSKHKECTVCKAVLEKATIPQLKCAAPKLTKVESTGSGVKVTWSKTAGADSYNIYRKTYSNGKWSGWSTIKTGATGTTYTDTTAKSGVYYIYTVRAKNEAGLSGYNSTGLKIKFLATPKLSSVANGSGKVTVKWSKVTGASSYTVYRKTYSNGKWSGWSKIGTTKNTYYNDAKVSGGKYYKYTVRATSGDYISYYNTSGLQIKYLAGPKISSASSRRDGILINWNKITGASGYYVYRKTSSGDWKKIATVKGNTKIKYLDETPRNGVTYQYRVKAYSGNSTSTYANTYKITCKY